MAEHQSDAQANEVKRPADTAHGSRLTGVTAYCEALSQFYTTVVKAAEIDMQNEKAKREFQSIGKGGDACAETVSKMAEEGVYKSSLVYPLPLEYLGDAFAESAVIPLRVTGGETAPRIEVDIESVGALRKRLPR